MIVRFPAVFLALVTCLAMQFAIAPAFARVLVFVPSSMTDVMREIAALHEANTGQEVVLSFAATSQLARQLDAGAPADVFLTADEQWMGWALDRKLVKAESAVTFAGNRLVVAVRREVENWADIAEILTTERFAMADPEAVPAGRYGKQALQTLGLWDAAQGNAVRTETARTTLNLVARGEVEAAIVYQTDIAIEPRVRAAFTFEAASHSPIRYVAAATAKGGDAADAFVEALGSPAVQAVLRKAGFSVPPFEKVQ